MTDVKLPEPAKWVWDAIQDPREQAVGIAEAMRAYATAAVMADRDERWRPIETAEEIHPAILWNGDYITIGNKFGGVWFDHTETNNHPEFDDQPTHWQPLPQPPAEDGE